MKKKKKRSCILCIRALQYGTIVPMYSYIHRIGDTTTTNKKKYPKTSVQKFPKGQFCLFYLPYNVSYFIIIEKLIQLPK